MTKDNVWKDIEDKNLDILLKVSKEEFFDECEDWYRRDIPKETEKLIQQDVHEYCQYIMDTLSMKKKYDLVEAKMLHEKMCRWKPENFPLKTSESKYNPREDEP